MAKRLLFLAPTPPSDRHGPGALRMLHLLHFLGSRFQVDLVAPAHEGVEDAQELLRDLCVEMVFVPPRRPGFLHRVGSIGPYAKDHALAAVVRERLASGNYGAVHVEKPLMIPSVPPRTSIPLVLDIWADGPASSLRRLSTSRDEISRSKQVVRLIKLGLFNKYCWPSTYCMLVISEEDRILCERHHPGRRVLVVPNGVDCRTIIPKPDHTAGSPVLLFTGDMGSEPTIEAAILLANDVFPAIRREFPQAELRLVGRNPSQRLRRLAGLGIVITGAVPGIQLHLRAATMYVAPHITGSGARTHLLEAMAVGLPIITTAIGIEGMKVQPGRDLVIADQPSDMVESIHTLLASQADRERFGRAARRTTEVWYDWNSCLWPLESLYQELLEPKAVAC